MALFDLLLEIVHGLWSMALFIPRILSSVFNTPKRLSEFKQLKRAELSDDQILSSNQLQRVFISCGDMSGESHALQLVARLQAHSPEIKISGFGGKRLAAKGMNIWESLADLNVMGFADVARQLPLFFNCIFRFANEIRKQKPDIVVLVDYPGLNQRLLRICKRHDIPVVQFIAPQLWAWADWRVKDFKKANALLTILPFEDDWFRKHGAYSVYVGHPLGDGLENIAETEASLPVAMQNWQEETWVGILPGSRNREIERNLPAMLRAAEHLAHHQPDCRFVIPHLRDAAWRSIKPILDKSNIQVVMAAGQFHRVIPKLKLAMVTSGTASLEVAAHGVPNIVCYAIPSAFKEWLAKRVVAVPWAGSLNLIAGHEIAPEHIGRELHSVEMARDLELLLSDSGRKQFLMDLAGLEGHFKEAGCADRVANAVIYQSFKNKSE